MDDLDHNGKIDALLMFSLSGICLTVALFASGILLWLAYQGSMDWFWAVFCSFAFLSYAAVVSKALMDRTDL